MEKDGGALKRLAENIQTLRVAERSMVLRGDVFTAAAKLPDGIDLFFLDPPYRFVREKPAEIQRLTEEVRQKHLNPEGVLIFRHDPEDALVLPGFRSYDQRDYGRMRIELLRREP